MHRLWFCSFLLALFNAASGVESPNIIFVMADDLGYGDPQCYRAESKISTPNMDRLAREGMRFTDAHTPSAVCTPTRYGVLTGRYCWRSSLKKGVLYGDSPALIEQKRLTVAGMLKHYGYHTGVVGKWHLGLGNGFNEQTDFSQRIPHGPLSLGFDHSYIIPASLDMAPYLWLHDDVVLQAPTVQDEGSKRVWAGGNGFWRAGLRAPDFTFDGVLPTIANQASRYLSERAKQSDKPFFLYVPLASPHTPWVPSEAYRGKTSIGAYGDFVYQTDAALGQILKTLDDEALTDNTLIIFTSDNGSHWPASMIEKTGHRANGDWRGQKADIHEAGHRVPFLARWPGQVKAGSVSDQLICLADLMGTAASIVGHPLGKAEGEDSYDLLPILKSTTTKSVRKAIVHHSLGGTFAIRIDNWKLILGKGSGGFTKVPVAADAPEGQLYNLKNDPTETTNRYTEKPKIVAKLRQTLERYQRIGFSRLPGDTEALLERLKENQFKRIHQELFRTMLRGKPRVALEAMNQLSPDLVNHGESHYMRAVAHSMLGELDVAAAAALRATAAGVSLNRLVGGTKTGLEELQSHPVFAQLREGLDPIVHGPMLGQVSGSSATVWVRSLEAAEVRIAVSTNAEDFSQALISEYVSTNTATDFTAKVPVEGLKPQSSYHYRVLVGDQSATDSSIAVHHLKTTVEPLAPTKIRIAFGGGAGFVPENERAFDTIRTKDPDALFLLGDNVYSDDPESPSMQHYCYYRRQARPEFSALVAQTPVYSIWDDHDFGVNDCVEGPEIDLPAWKRPVYEVFRDNWVNPGFGGGDAQPGCYYDFYLGDVHVIMLDGRFYRNLDPGLGEISMLGKVQRDWLLEKVQKSAGTFKILCSPVPWVYEAKGDSKDTWNGFKDERSLIFKALAEHKIEGVLLMSADRHRSDLWKIDRPDTYPLYEFNSSRLTNQHVHKTMEAAVFSYNAKQSFGLLDVDTTLADPSVVYSVVSIDGEVIHSFRLLRTELQ